MNNGYVTLVGAGCGWDLITVQGLRALQAADVLVYDALIDTSLLRHVKPNCECIYVGKRAGNHSEKQEAITKLLIEKARGNKHVVRLKGGDSFVFGRGGEEILALQQASIPYTVIPGVTSAVAVPEILGIPVTHRGLAQSFTVVTGHTATDLEENYKALAELDGTLVFLMGLHNLTPICEKLMANGKDKHTPAAILSCGFSQYQKRLNGTLENIADRAGEASAPAILIVGGVASLELQKTKAFPLDGVSVTVTGTKDFVFRLSEKLTALGASVEEAPCLRIVPHTDEIPQTFDDYTNLVFTSANGVKIFFDALKEKHIDFRCLAHLKFACIGVGSAQRLAAYGFQADFIPSVYTAETLGKELSASLTCNDRVLILRAANASEELTKALRGVSIPYTDIKIYTTAAEKKAVGCDTDYITFASASGVTAFFKNGGRIGRAKPICIGTVTAATFQKYSEISPLIAEMHTAEGIISLITEDQYEKIQTAAAE